MPEDGKLYYKLWLPLLDYVNKKHHINDLKNIATAESLDPAKVRQVAAMLIRIEVSSYKNLPCHLTDTLLQ